MGPSGSGKSTLLHCLAGLIAPDSGTIQIGSTTITGLSDAHMTRFRRRQMGLIFQDFNLIPTLTAEENVALPLLLDRAGKNATQRAAELLDLLGLAQRRHHTPDTLSGGERQRVAIARALVTHPTVVLADEPTGNLDSPAAHAFCSLLKKMNEQTGCAILLVTHDPVVAATAQSVHILKDGQIGEQFETHGDPTQVAQHYLKAMQGSTFHDHL